MLVFYEGADFEVGADPDLLSPDGGRAREVLLPAVTLMAVQ
jgi:hypothetical protein